MSVLLSKSGPFGLFFGVMLALALLAGLVPAGCGVKDQVSWEINISAPEADKVPNPATLPQEISSNSGSAAKAAFQDSATYNGRADSNFIEVHLSGVPGDQGLKVFQLSDQIKEKFDQIRLQKNDQIFFTYIKQASGNSMIIELRKIKT